MAKFRFQIHKSNCLKSEISQMLTVLGVLLRHFTLPRCSQWCNEQRGVSGRVLTPPTGDVMTLHPIRGRLNAFSCQWLDNRDLKPWAHDGSCCLLHQEHPSAPHLRSYIRASEIKKCTINRQNRTRIYKIINWKETINLFINTRKTFT